MSVRIAVLGGSAVVTPQLVEALGEQAELADEAIAIVLIGRTAPKLEQVAAISERVAARNIVIEAETDLDSGVRDADYIVNQVRVGGLEARAFDERFPQQLMLPGEETMGPGGFANAWRTLPVVATLFARCAALAPNAHLLNLTNPAGMVHQAAVRADLKVTTFCDSPVVLAEQAAVNAGVEPTAAVPSYVGTNHGGWLTTLLDEHGRDVLPGVLEDAAFVEALGFDSLLVARLGVLPNVYLRYVYHPERQLAAQRAKERVRAEELLDLEQETLASYSEGRELAAIVSQRRAVWYSACIAPALTSFITGTAARMIAGITNQGLVDWIPNETMLEVPVRLGADGAEPLGAIDSLPEDVASLLTANAAYESLAVEAILHGDQSDRVRALAANPMVASVEVARRAVEAIVAREGLPVAA